MRVVQEARRGEVGRGGGGEGWRVKKKKLSGLGMCCRGLRGAQDRTGHDRTGHDRTGHSSTA